MGKADDFFLSDWSKNACTQREKILEIISVGLQSPTSLSMDLYDAKLRTLRLKKAQKHFSELVQSVFFHFCSSN